MAVIHSELIFAEGEIWALCSSAYEYQGFQHSELEKLLFLHCVFDSDVSMDLSRLLWNVCV